MEEYTWDDIITNPLDEKVKNCIGKRVYYSELPKSCLYAANHNNMDSGILIEVNEDNIRPFRIKKNKFCGFGDFSCIILKKEYVPFDNIEELIEASLEHNKNHYLSKIGGLWLKKKETGLFELTTAINPNNDYFYFDINPYYIKNLFDKYCFLDDTPCGKKLQEIDNG